MTEDIKSDLLLLSVTLLCLRCTDPFVATVGKLSLFGRVVYTVLKHGYNLTTGLFGPEIPP